MNRENNRHTGTCYFLVYSCYITCKITIKSCNHSKTPCRFSISQFVKTIKVLNTISP
uniref:Uncharacterized protein n=1 Tax=Triticum urartu TaxID=4572 RepID=A0A8R7PBX0_TRIUA